MQVCLLGVIRAHWLPGRASKKSGYLSCFPSLEGQAHLPKLWVTMPSILSTIVGEKVKLETSGESPYKPPQQVPNDKEPSEASDARINQSSIARTGNADVNTSSKSTDRANGFVKDCRLGAVSKTSGSTGANRRDVPLRKTSEGSMVNGDSRPSQEAAEGGTTSDRHIEQSSSVGYQGPEHSKLTSPQSRRSYEKDQIARIWQKGHGRDSSTSAPQRFSPTYLNSIEGSPPPQGSAESGPGQTIPKAAQAPSATYPEHATSTTSLQATAPRLLHRHTLEVPRMSTSRTSRDFSYTHPVSDAATESDRLTPTLRTPRGSNTIVRAPTRSVHSDMNLDDVPPDSDMARWTETVRQKRASRRKKKDEEEDDRVVVGTKVDINHVNWVTAYNMLTGIRFTVSRTHAKIDRDLTDSDFDARHKFSFDITGNELTPSAKYDFKFKDYAPWVFRHLRARFQIDPADYLMSLTSKYILSELGSPGKSGSFFYFSRDYKYIIKTIHHAEHKLMRKILREYYTHCEKHPNTLISQFYGLHRVKIPYGRKIHFVVMNNLFPPHRDIHQTFDLKGSTIGRDFKEEDLARNPRATLKDLNWLRRNYHFEFGPQKKTLFVEQMRRDVALLQRLKIMDYSLLIGIHDLNKGNEENLRDKTLRVFQPGGDDEAEPQAKMLTRTPSKMENVRQAKQLRQIIKKERPVPMDQSTSKMPEEMLEERKNFIFYSDDGGFRATHEDGQPGEEIYYLGIIDCLTHVSWF